MCLVPLPWLCLRALLPPTDVYLPLLTPAGVKDSRTWALPNRLFRWALTSTFEFDFAVVLTLPEPLVSTCRREAIGISLLPTADPL